MDIMKTEKLYGNEMPARNILKEDFLSPDNPFVKWGLENLWLPEVPIKDLLTHVKMIASLIDGFPTGTTIRDAGNQLRSYLKNDNLVWDAERFMIDLAVETYDERYI